MSKITQKKISLEKETPQDDISRGFAKSVSESSVHGDNYIFNSKSQLAKSIWTLLVLSATLGLFCHLYSLTQKYFDYSFYDQMLYSKESALIFPQVTVCDNEGLSEFSMTKEKLNIFGDVARKWQLMDLFTKNNTHAYVSEYKYLRNSWQGLQSNIPESDRISVGHAVEDFILGCTYLDYQCNADHFSLYMHPSYWNCYTFKGISEKGNPNPNYNNIGPNNGLSLISATQKPVINVFYDAGSKSKNTHAFKVSVHEPGTDPAISETGIDILPGMSTSFALEQKEYHRLKYPYADCQEGTAYNVSNHLFNMTPALCHKACLAEYVMEKCNCLSTKVDIFFTSPETENVKSCLHANESDPQDSVQKSLCEISVLKNISNIPRERCDCGWTCHEVDYDVLVSQVEWPQKFTIVNFLETYINASSSKAMKFIFEELRNYYKNPNISSSCAAKLSSSDLVLMVTNKTINLLNSSVLEEIKKSNITSCVDKKLTEQGSFVSRDDDERHGV